MNHICKEYYLIDIIIDGNVIRKGKYTKVLSPIDYYWIDYKGVIVDDLDEIKRLDLLAIKENKIEGNFDDYSYFMSSYNKTELLNSIPMNKHVILVSYTPSSDSGHINMKYEKGVEGDSYLIYITNIGDVTTTVYTPTKDEGGKDDPIVYTNNRTDVNVGGLFLSIGSGATEAIRVTYRDGKWFWEVESNTADNQGSVTLGDADFLAFRYIWNSDSGTDLDTATELLNSGISGVDNHAVGWNCPGNNNSTVTSLLKWGGDNRGSGQECVYISIKELRENYIDTLPSITEFMTYATWFASKGTGKASFNLIAYKGGTMSQDGFNFINTGGVEVYNKIHSFDVTTYKGMPNYKTDYTQVTKITYNKDNNTVSMAVGDTVIDNQQGLQEIDKRIKLLEKDNLSIHEEIKDISLKYDTVLDNYTNLNTRYDNLILELGDIKSILDKINGE